MTSTSDFAKQVGRDGAYVEMDVTAMDEMITSIRQDGSFNPKMIVLKQARLDITDPKFVSLFKTAVAELVDSTETEGMDNAQMGLYAFRKIFEAGLKTFSETDKPYDQDPSPEALS